MKDFSVAIKKKLYLMIYKLILIKPGQEQSDPEQTLKIYFFI